MGRVFAPESVLRRIATDLTDEQLIAHPSLAAITLYDPAANTNRYSCLHTDWQDDYGHFQYPHYQYVHTSKELIDFLHNPSISENLPSKVGLSDWDRYHAAGIADQADITQFIKLVAKELKLMFFYEPLIKSKYDKFLADPAGNRYSFISLENKHIPPNEVRAALEKANGHSGHWLYGFALEQFYLYTQEYNYYFVYFMRTQEDKKDIGGPFYVLCATCSTEALAQKIGYWVESHRQKYGIPKTPFRKVKTIDQLRLRAVKKLDSFIPKDEHISDKRRDLIKYLELCEDESCLNSVLKKLNSHIDGLLSYALCEALENAIANHFEHTDIEPGQQSA